jgi:hypothetical protein
MVCVWCWWGEYGVSMARAGVGIGADGVACVNGGDGARAGYCGMRGACGVRLDGGRATTFVRGD